MALPPLTYLAVCTRCDNWRDVARSEVESGRAPFCRCGKPMTLYARRAEPEGKPPPTRKPKAVA